MFLQKGINPDYLLSGCDLQRPTILKATSQQIVRVDKEVKDFL
jgi:hypothetical protein